jgi:lantibiotic modifying enzyme
VLQRPESVDLSGAGEPQAALEPELQQRLLADGLAHLAAAAYQAAPDQLMASNQRGVKSDSCNVQSGVAGVLAVLVRASERLGTESLRAAVARLAGWLDRNRFTAQQLLPGLYFGRAGMAWALFDAARHLDDDGLATRALELATALPVRWPNPDITFGTAGAGLTSLHLWYETKEPVLLDRVHAAVDHLVETAQRTDGRVFWQVPTDFDSRLAGVVQLGFAHGVAGIGAFLLAAWQATGREDARQVAEQAGHTLAGAAVREGGTAYWPNGLSGPDESDMRYHWCSGASGVGTFLVRLWQATGEPRYRQLAHEAAVAVRRTRWLHPLPACHGLPGSGEFLLDLAAADGGSYRDWAEEIAAAIYVRLGEWHGRLVGSDEPDGRVFFDFNTGYAGVVGFALRLVHGGPRWWMVDRPST